MLFSKRKKQKEYKSGIDLVDHLRAFANELPKKYSLQCNLMYEAADILEIKIRGHRVRKGY